MHQVQEASEGISRVNMCLNFKVSLRGDKITREHYRKAEKISYFSKKVGGIPMQDLFT